MELEHELTGTVFTAQQKCEIWRCRSGGAADSSLLASMWRCAAIDISKDRSASIFGFSLFGLPEPPKEGTTTLKHAYFM